MQMFSEEYTPQYRSTPRSILLLQNGQVSWRGKSLQLNLYVTTGPRRGQIDDEEEKDNHRNERGVRCGARSYSPVRTNGLTQWQWWPGCNDIAERSLAEHQEPEAVHQVRSCTESIRG